MTTREEARARLIYALDADGLAEARAWVEHLRESVGVFKIGYQLFWREGPRAVEMVQAAGAKVFLDLKLHDIPHTVAKAARESARMGVFMMNVHAAGGQAMMEAAVKAAKEEADMLGRPRPLVIGVTVLTSLNEEAVKAVGFAETPEQLVLRLAGLAAAAGLDGVVASPQEAAQIRKERGPDFKIVCPGVRPSGSAKGDQARVATPREAIAAGADFLVVGRPIRDAKDPAKAANDLLAEMI